MTVSGITQIRVHGAIHGATSATVPGAPTGLSATLNGATTIALSWTAPASAGSSAITGYRIEVSSDGGAAFTDLIVHTGNANTTWAHVGVAAGATHRYRVSAINAVGVGAPSSVANATTALASNVDQTSAATATALSGLDVAQEFVTGDNGAGYTLSSIDVRLTRVGEVTTNYPAVKVFSGSATGTQVAELTAPSTAGTALGVDDFTNYTFAAPANVTLAGGTSYWVVLEGSSSGVIVTSSSVEDATSAPGWEIADNYLSRGASSTASFRDTLNFVAQVRVRGVIHAATVGTVPGAPTDLSATLNGATTIDLSWTAPASIGSSAIAGYRIEVSSGVGATFTDLVADTGNANTTYAHVGAAAGATHRYRVSAINAVGVGAPSSVANATTALASNVDQTSAATATALSGLDVAQEFVTGDNGAGYTLSSIDVRLTRVGAVTTNYPAVKVFSGSATGTEVAELTAPSTAGTAVGSRDRTNYTFTAPANVTLIGGTSYWVVLEGSSSGVVVTASSVEDATSAPGWEIVDNYQRRNANSTASFTDVANFVAQIRVHGAMRDAAAGAVPGAPTGLSATLNGATTIDLSWTAPVSIGSHVVTGYWIEVSADGGATFTDLVADTGNANTTYAHTGAAAGATGHYRVSAINPLGAGAPSNVADATTALVSNVGQTSASGEALLTSFDVAQEFVTGDNSAGYALSSVDVRLVSVGAVTTNYPTVKVVSGSATGTEVADLTAPSTAGSSDDTNYTFTAPANVTLAGGTSYWVVLEGSSSGVLRTASSAEDATSAPGWEIADRYQRRSASSTTGYSTVTDAHAAQIRVHGVIQVATVGTVPGASTGLSATLSGATTIDLSWTAPSSAGSAAITGYRIEISADGGATFTDLVADTGNSNTTYAHIGVPAATTRHYRVSAINPVGAGPASNVANATTALVSNVGQTTFGSEQLGSTYDVAQEFTTGDNSDGYTLSSIEVRLRGVGAVTTNYPTLKVMSGSANGTEVAELTAPSTAGSSGDGNYAYTAPANVTLAGGTSYWVVYEGSSSGVTSTNSSSEDATSASGWEIADHYQRRDASSTAGYSTGEAGHVAQIRVHGAIHAAMVGTVPGAPTGLSATSGGTTTIDLSWTAPASTGSSAITGYRIEVSSDGGATFTDLVADTGNTGTTYAHTGLADGATRHYRVSAINSAGAGAPSDVDGATTATDTPTALVSNLGQNAHGHNNLDSYDIAQEFVTGDNRTGYSLSSIEVRLKDVGAVTTNYPTVKVLSGSANGTAVAELTAPSTVGSSGDETYTYTAPANVTLASETSYWVVYDQSSSGVLVTHSFSEDATPVAGWSIADDFQIRDPGTNGSFVNFAGSVAQIRVNGVISTAADAGAPAAPTGLSATHSGGARIDLSWTAPSSDGGAAVTGYRIESSPNGAWGWTSLVVNTGTTATTYADTGLNGGVTRHYRVSGINPVGTGTPSNVAGATTDATVPGAPTGLTATAVGSARIDLSWAAPSSDGGPAITGYKIEISSDGGVTFTDLVGDTGNANTTYAHTELAGGTTRHYRVSAINPVGTGAPSNVAGAGTALVSNTGQSTTASTLLSTYDMAQAFTTGDHSAGYTLSSVAVRLRDIGAVTTNYPTVKVVSGAANGAEVAELTAPSTVGSSGDGNYTYTAPANVTLASGTSYWVVLEGSSSGVSLTSSTAEDTASAPSWEVADNYQRRSANTTETFADVASLVAQIRVNGAINATSGVAVPAAPTSLSATASGSSRIDLSWTAPASNGGAAITGYRIEVSSDGGTTFTDLAANTGITNTTYSHTEVAPGTTHHYRVSAINPVGTGTPSNVDSATTGTTAPGAPTGFSARTGGNTRIDLSWTAPASNGGSAITGYKIESSSDGGASFTDLVANTDNTDRTYAHTGLAAGNTRHYRVSAINSVGTGPPSNVANANTALVGNLGKPRDGLDFLSGHDNAQEFTTGDNSAGYTLSAISVRLGDVHSHRGGYPTVEVFSGSAIGTKVATLTAPSASPGGTGTYTYTAPANVTLASATSYWVVYEAGRGTSASVLLTRSRSEDAASASGWSIANGFQRRHSASSGAFSSGSVSIAKLRVEGTINTTTNAAVPGSPTSLSATTNGTTRIDLSWTAPASNGGAAITGYKIESSSDGGRGWSDLVGNTGNTTATYAHTGLTGGTTRHYRVSAINSVGTGTPSNVDRATTNGVPGAPTRLSARSFGATRIRLSWAAPASNGSAITGYKIESSTDGGVTFTDLAGNTGNANTYYTHTGLVGGTTRHYRVFAINSVGTGAASNVDSATTDTVPGAPTGLSATASGATRIDLSWTAPASDGGAAITGYRIESSSDAGATFTDLVADTGATSTTYAHEGLAGGATLHYQVSAINPVGTGAPSGVASATTVPRMSIGPGTQTVSEEVGNVVLTVFLDQPAPTTLQVAWNTQGDSAESPDDFTARQGTLTFAAGETRKTISVPIVDDAVQEDPVHSAYEIFFVHLSPGSGYSLSGTASAFVEIVDNDGDPVPPRAPTGLSATSGGATQIDLSWTAPSNNGGAAITGYRIEVSSDGGANWSDLVANTGNTDTTYAHIGMAGGATRHYRVSAINATGVSTASNVANATTGATAPGAPTGLSATSGGATRIDLSWTAPLSDGGAAITGYRIESSTDGGVTFTDLVADTGNANTTYAHTGLAEGVTRHYRVSAINSVGTGAPSNVDSATSVAAGAPGAPADLSATASGTTRIDLSWTAPLSNGGAAVTGYRIEVSSDGGSSFTDLVANTGDTNTTYAHTGVGGGATRHYRVSAINSVGTGAPSNVAIATAALVSNLGETSAAASSALGDYDFAQELTTGDNGLGYTLSSIEIRLVDVGAVTTNYPTLKVMSGSANGTEVAELTAPSTDGSSDRTNYTYTAPANVTLASGTSYWVVYEGSSSAVVLTASTAEDATPAPGWSIADNYQRRPAGSTTSFADVSGVFAGQIRVRGATTAATVPGAPTGLSATASAATRIDLSWTAPSNNGGAAITGYRIEVSSDAGATFTDLVANTGSTDTTDAHTGVAVGATLHYRVSAINSVGTGAPSGIAGATTVPRVSIGPGSQSVSEEVGNAVWTVLLDEPGLTAVQVAWRTQDDSAKSPGDFTARQGTLTFAAGETRKNISVPIVDDTVREDPVQTAYETFFVHLSPGSGYSLNGTARNAFVEIVDNDGDPRPPRAPTGLSATSSAATRIDLSWTAPSNNGGAAITGYQIDVSSDGGITFARLVDDTGDTDTTHSHTGLAAGDTRHYRVSAINSVRAGAHSNIATATAGAPGAPTGLSATASGANRIDLSWTAPLSNGGVAITGYRIESSSDGGAAITGYKIEISSDDGATFTDLVANTGATTTSYAHSGLTPYTTRHYRVSAINSVGTGVPSGIADVTTVPRMSIGPGFQTVFEEVGNAVLTVSLEQAAPTALQVAWRTQDDSAKSPGDFTARQGTLTFAAGETRKNISVPIVDDTVREDPVLAVYEIFFVHLSPGSGYSLNGVTSSAFVEIVDNNGGPTPPRAPTGLSATSGGTTRIDLSWTAPARDGGAAITGYKIEISSDGGVTWTDLVANTGDTNTTYAHTGLADGATRHYRVFAINSVGVGTPSIVASATTGANSDPTVASPIPDRSATAGATFSYAFPGNTFSDPDTGDTLSYTAMQDDGTALPAWLSFTAAERKFSGTPQAADVGTLAVRVTASDGKGGSVSDTFTLTVGNVGDLVVNFATEPGAHPVKVRESGTPHRLILLLSEEAPQPLTIPLVVTHRGGATEADYTDLPRNVTFQAGKRVAGFHLRAIPDQALEPGEGLRLDFGILPSSVRKGTRGPYEVVEFVDEVLAERTVRFGAAAYTATEGGAAATVSIHLDAPAEVAPLEVGLRLRYRGGATAADLESIPTAVTFAVGERTRRFTITATDDADDDDGESVSLSFVADVSGRVTTGGGPATATVALVDNDPGPGPEPEPEPERDGTCVAGAHTLCLGNYRYAVTVDWRTAGGELGIGNVVQAGTNDSGMFHFFGANNWEILIKILDGCALNGHVWVFAASTTDVGYVIRVADTASGATREYRNEPGTPAAAITDSSAFPESCRPQ